MTEPRITIPPEIERIALSGDLSKLTEDQKVVYYNAVCASVGLNPLTNPFEYTILNGKLRLYPRANAADQLRQAHCISIHLTNRQLIGDTYHITASADSPDGRHDEATGVVWVKGLSGEGLANAYMKCETKAKRRVTLSMCGLQGFDSDEEPRVQSLVQPLAPQPTQPPILVDPPTLEAEEIPAAVQPEPSPQAEVQPEWMGFINEMAKCEWKKQVTPIKDQAREWFKKRREKVPPEFIAKMEAIEATLP